MTSEEFNDNAQALLAKTASELGEQFDNVQILASIKDSEMATAHFGAGSGDMFARIGLCSMFLKEQEGYHISRGRLSYRENCIKDGINPDGE